MGGEGGARKTRKEVALYRPPLVTMFITPPPFLPPSSSQTNPQPNHPAQSDFMSHPPHCTPRPFNDHFTSKYAVSTDGWTASSRLEKVMLTGSAVLKQASPRFTYFDQFLHPFEHYVPFWTHNATDILQVGLLPVLIVCLWFGRTYHGHQSSTLMLLLLYHVSSCMAWSSIFCSDGAATVSCFQNCCLCRPHRPSIG